MAERQDDSTEAEYKGVLGHLRVRGRDPLIVIGIAAYAILGAMMYQHSQSTEKVLSQVVREMRLATCISATPEPQRETHGTRINRRFVIGWLNKETHMRYLTLLLTLTACAPIPDQKIGDGQAGCMTVSSVYGSASSVVTRADNTPRGASSNGKTRITCGSAVMEIESVVTQPPPPPLNPAVGGAGVGR